LVSLPVKRSVEKPLSSDFLIDIDPLTENQRKLFLSLMMKVKISLLMDVPELVRLLCLLYNALKEVLDERTPYEKIYIVRSISCY
jgi:hypothetical protein